MYRLLSPRTRVITLGSTQGDGCPPSLFYLLWCLLYAVTNHGNPAALLYFHWSLNLQFLTAVLSILIIILIFTNRITLLIGKKRYLWGLMLLMVAATTIISTVSFVMGFYITNFQEYRDRTLWTAYLNLSVTIACDSVTTTSLIFVLRKQKSPFKRSRSTINKVIFYTVNTAALTSVTSVACLVTFVVLPSSLVYLALVFILPKLYLNSLLGLLNCRKKLRSELLHDGPISILFDSSVNRVVLSTANDAYGVKANVLVHSS